jgi:hypothetical protein
LLGVVSVYLVLATVPQTVQVCPVRFSASSALMISRILTAADTRPVAIKNPARLAGRQNNTG